MISKVSNNKNEMKKKILIRIGSLRHGGAEKVLVTFLKNLPVDKYEIDLLLNLYSGKYLKEVPLWINIFYLNRGEMITTNRLRDIPQKIYRILFQGLLKKNPKLLYKYILKDKKYDIEFAAIQGMRDDILTSPNKDSKKIVWIHSDLRKASTYDYTDNEMHKFFGFDTIMVNSEEVLEDFKNLARNEEEKSRLIRIYNPLDTTEVLRLSEFPLEQNVFEKEIPTFVSIGTVYPAKGFDRLFNVHKRLLAEGFFHKILIIGDGYDFENISKLRSELGLDGTVKMMGYIKNPYPYLKAADFFVLSSVYESFPTVLFEAVTLKKKIISTLVPGASELLNNGELGCLVENSEEGIYRGMKEFLTNPELAGRYQNKIANFTHPFSLENSVKKIEQILDEL